MLDTSVSKTEDAAAEEEAAVDPGADSGDAEAVDSEEEAFPEEEEMMVEEDHLEPLMVLFS